MKPKYMYGVFYNSPFGIQSDKMYKTLKGAEKRVKELKNKKYRGVGIEKLTPTNSFFFRNR